MKQLNPFLDDFAEFRIDPGFIAAMNAAEREFGAVANEAFQYQFSITMVQGCQMRSCRARHVRQLAHGTGSVVRAQMRVVRTHGGRVVADNHLRQRITCARCL